MILSPNDNPVSGSKSDAVDGNFGGNREFTTGTHQKSQDYKKTSGGAVDVQQNPVDETILDIDDLADPSTRKREFSRRAETADRRDHNKEHFHESDPENRPREETSPVIVPDNKKHGSKLPYHFGEGQYEGEIS